MCNRLTGVPGVRKCRRAAPMLLPSLCRYAPARSAAAVAVAPGLAGFAGPDRGISPGMRRRSLWRGLSEVESPRSHHGLAHGAI
jgi:hypothetical protein